MLPNYFPLNHDANRAVTVRRDRHGVPMGPQASALRCHSLRVAARQRFPVHETALTG
jgi:hypothetical protein